MRLIDLFEQEFGTAKLSKNQERVLPPILVLPALNSGNNYPQYRFNTIMAAARAIKAGEVPFKALVPWASAMSITAYVPEEMETVRIAAKLAGLEVDDINDSPSMEPDWVNTVSPVANIPMTESRRGLREEENVPRSTETPDITQPKDVDPKTDIAQVKRHVVVIYPGRFQPLHQAHQQVYRNLQARFPDADVYIATSDKTDDDKSPFTFQDKVAMARAAGLPTDKIVQVKSPYAPQEITSRYDPQGTVLLIAVGAKDMAEDPRFHFGKKKDGSPTYLQQYDDMDHAKSMDQHGYVIEAPTIEFALLGQPVTSATQIRKAYRHADSKARDAIIAGLYDHPSLQLRRLFDSRLGGPLQEATGSTAADLLPMMRDFLALAKTELRLPQLPRIVWSTDSTAHGDRPTFGKFVNDSNTITISIINRHPVDIMRTLAHELTHYRQNLNKELDAHSGDTGSAEENKANAMAGIIMRKFDAAHPEAFGAVPIQESQIREVSKERLRSFASRMIDQHPGTVRFVGTPDVKRRRALDLALDKLQPDTAVTKPKIAATEEGEVIPFKRPDLNPRIGNFHAAKSLAKQLYWMQASSQWTHEDDEAELEVLHDLHNLGYYAEADLDHPAAEQAMIITHLPSGRTYRMGEEELLQGAVSEDQPSYLQAPLDPEGDTDGPGKTGDQWI